MTIKEMQTISEMLAGYMVEAIKRDNDLADIICPPRFMNIEQASEFTGLATNTIYSKIKEIPHAKCGRRLVFSDRLLARWLNNKMEAGI